MQGDHEIGEHASPEEPWPGASAEAQQISTDDGATWHADQASLQRALDQAIAQPIDPSRRPMWTDASGEGYLLPLQCLARDPRHFCSDLLAVCGIHTGRDGQGPVSFLTTD